VLALTRIRLSIRLFVCHSLFLLITVALSASWPVLERLTWFDVVTAKNVVAKRYISGLWQQNSLNFSFQV